MGAMLSCYKRRPPSATVINTLLTRVNFQNQITLPLPSRLHNHLLCPYHHIISNFFHLLISLALEDTTASCSTLKTVKESLAAMLDSVRGRISEASTFSSKRDAMEYVVNCVEVACVSAMVCLLCAEVGRPQAAHHKKGRRRSEAKTRDVVGEVGVALREHLQGFEAALREWAAPAVDDDITVKLEMLNLNGAGYRDVRDSLVNSHECAVKELQGVLRSKCKLLNGLLA